jgi:hypothetical protein
VIKRGASWNKSTQTGAERRLDNLPKHHEGGYQTTRTQTEDDNGRGNTGGRDQSESNGSASGQEKHMQDLA